MAKMLIIYSSTDGQTKKICDRLRRIIEGHGHRATLIRIDDAHDVDPLAFDTIVIGASIRYGKHNAQVVDFVNKHADALDARQNAFFSVNIVARKPDKSRPQNNPYLRAFLKQVRWRPKSLEVFAGRLDYPRYGCFDRLTIRLIMLLTGGPTDPRTTVEQGIVL
ncbi:MAG: menaquinone-dependent protoporphyrinogen IX dehydrogenase [Betaproteobacteria bacterium]|nr:MAG: menaquinone-dependent protoporphyrinogen IX dehydrogenase [Betaproteobacteria bacterium]